MGGRPYETVLHAARSLQSAHVAFGASEQGNKRKTKHMQDDWRSITDRSMRMHVKIMPADKGAATCIDLEPADATSR